MGASGRGIYAFTAPLVVEAMQRILEGNCHTLGLTTPGETFDAPGFLATLAEPSSP